MPHTKNIPEGITLKLSRHAIARMAERGAFNVGEYGHFAMSRAASFLRRGLLRHGRLERISGNKCFLRHGLWCAVVRQPQGKKGKHWTCVTVFPDAEIEMPTFETMHTEIK